jgi:hypothetical protein
MIAWPLIFAIMGTLFILFAVIGARLRARLPPGDDELEA